MATTEKASEGAGYRALARKVDAVGAARANVALRALTGMRLFECSADRAVDALWGIVLEGERTESQVRAALDAAVAS